MRFGVVELRREGKRRVHHAQLRSRTHPNDADGPRRGNDQNSHRPGDTERQGAPGRIHLEGRGRGPDDVRLVVDRYLDADSDGSLDAELNEPAPAVTPARA